MKIQLFFRIHTFLITFWHGIVVTDLRQLFAGCLHPVSGLFRSGWSLVLTARSEELRACAPAFPTDARARGGCGPPQVAAG